MQSRTTLLPQPLEGLKLSPLDVPHQGKQEGAVWVLARMSPAP